MRPFFQTPATNTGRMGPLPNPPQSTKKIQDCVKTLRQMGYGMSDPNEMARLSVYASATGGNVVEAVDMIEEDRQAAALMGQESGITNIRVL